MFIAEAEHLLKKALPGKKLAFEKPPKGFGDIACTIAFDLAKIEKKNPAEIAKKIVEKIKLPKDSIFESVKAVGPYINFFLNKDKFAKSVLSSKVSFPKKSKKVIVEHTSVNPGKPLHFGHVRNLVLGDSVSRIMKFLGYNIEVQYYIDDLGKQVATLIWGLENLNVPKNNMKTDLWHGLIYIQANKVAEEKPEVMDYINNTIMKEMEDAGTKYGKLCNKLCEESVKSQLETPFGLGVYYDLLIKESDIVRYGVFEKALKKIIKSDKVYKATSGPNKGCVVINMASVERGLENPEKIIVRSNEVPTYTGKDIGYQMWKFGLIDVKFMFKNFIKQPNGKQLIITSLKGRELKNKPAEKVINVIGCEQDYPQKVVYLSLRLIGYEKQADNSHHLSYALMNLPGQRFSGRKGNWYSEKSWADYIIDKTINLAKKNVKERNSKLSEKKVDEISKKIAAAAVKFFILKQELKKELVYNPKEALAFEGDTGPYLQYAGVRAKRIIQKSKSKKAALIKAITDEEFELLKQISDFSSTVETAGGDYKPNLIANYCLELAKLFTNFYMKCRVIGSDEESKRIKIIKKYLETLEKGLNLLGIEVPDIM